MFKTFVSLLPGHASYYIFWVCVCSLSYPGCKAHAPYYTSSVACTGLPHFVTLSRERHDIRKKLL